MPEKRTKTKESENQGAGRQRAMAREGPVSQYEEPDLLAVQRTVSNPSLASPADIMVLQRRYGNRAARSVIERTKLSDPLDTKPGNHQLTGAGTAPGSGEQARPATVVQRMPLGEAVAAADAAGDLKVCYQYAAYIVMLRYAKNPKFKGWKTRLLVKAQWIDNASVKSMTGQQAVTDATTYRNLPAGTLLLIYKEGGGVLSHVMVKLAGARAVGRNRPTSDQFWEQLTDGETDNIPAVIYEQNHGLSLTQVPGQSARDQFISIANERSSASKGQTGIVL